MVVVVDAVVVPVVDRLLGHVQFGSNVTNVCVALSKNVPSAVGHLYTNMLARQ